MSVLEAIVDAAAGGNITIQEGESKCVVETDRDAEPRAWSIRIVPEPMTLPSGGANLDDTSRFLEAVIQPYGQGASPQADPPQVMRIPQCGLVANVIATGCKVDVRRYAAPTGITITSAQRLYCTAARSDARYAPLNGVDWLYVPAAAGTQTITVPTGARRVHLVDAGVGSSWQWVLQTGHRYGPTLAVNKTLANEIVPVLAGAVSLQFTGAAGDLSGTVAWEMA